MRKFLAHAPARGCRWLSILPAIAACLAVPLTPRYAIAGSSTQEKQETRTAPVATETRIYVKNARGKTIIVGRKNATEVTVRALKSVRAKDTATAERWMNELTYTLESDTKEFAVVTHQPEISQNVGDFFTMLKRLSDKAYIDYTIEVPSTFAVKVTTTSGDVQITSVDGDVTFSGSSGGLLLKSTGGGATVELSSGNVEVEGVAKDLNIRMSSGDAVVSGVGGSVTIQGTSGMVEVLESGRDVAVKLSTGDVVVRGCKGDVSVATSSGDTEIADIGGSLDAATTSGDITVELTPVGARTYGVESSSGDVEVTFHAAEGYGFTVEVNTNTGAIEGDLDIALDEVSRKTLKGVVGSGEGRLQIETATGNIRINQIGKTTTERK